MTCEFAVRPISLDKQLISSIQVPTKDDSWLPRYYPHYGDERQRQQIVA